MSFYHHLVKPPRVQLYVDTWIDSCMRWHKQLETACIRCDMSKDKFDVFGAKRYIAKQALINYESKLLEIEYVYQTFVEFFGEDDVYSEDILSIYSNCRSLCDILIDVRDNSGIKKYLERRQAENV